jgi:predicted dehydrogenase
MKKTRAVVVGCGVISGEHLAFLASASNVELVGVCDLSPAVAQFTAQRYGTQSFTDVAAMIESARPDVVHILTPPLSHEPLCRQALDAGCHVVCEKPLSPNAATTRSILAYAEARGRMVIESHNYRFNDQVVAIEELIASGRLGKVVSVTASVALGLSSGRLVDPNMPSPVSGLPGGAVHDFLPHQAYLVLHPLGYPKLRRVSSHWRNVSGVEAARYDEYDAILEFENDAVARLSVNSRVQPDSFRLYVQGSEGSAEAEFFQPYLRVDAPKGEGKMAGVLNTAAGGASLISGAVTGFRDKVLRHTAYHGMGRMLQGFYDSVASESPSPLTHEHVQAVADLVDALIEGAS